MSKPKIIKARSWSAWGMWTCSIQINEYSYSVLRVYGKTPACAYLNLVRKLVEYGDQCAGGSGGEYMLQTYPGEITKQYGHMYYELADQLMSKFESKAKNDKTYYLSN